MHDITHSTCDITVTICDTQHQGGDTASTSSSHPCVTWIIVYVPWMRDITHSACDVTHSKRDMQHQGGDTASTAVPWSSRFQKMHAPKSPPKIEENVFFWLRDSLQVVTVPTTISWNSRLQRMRVRKSPLEKWGECLPLRACLSGVVTVSRVPGLGQITWWIVMTKKIEGPFGETKFTKIEK